jgi:hypothetical protein
MAESPFINTPQIRLEERMCRREAVVLLKLKIDYHLKDYIAIYIT